jgi:N-acetylglucosamine kinase-like BadF-type ATPase
MSVVAGADVGATKTVAAVSEGDRELARVIGPGAAVRPDRAMSAAATLARVVRSALNQIGRLRVDALVVGAAGVGRDPERRALRDALRVEDLADRLQVTTDLEIALEAAFPAAPGVVLLVGTGSVAVARLPDGRIVRQGGYGWQMGDDGSGYALGRTALLEVGRAQDGRGPATALLATLCTAIRSDGFQDLVRWAANAEPAEVASLAGAVLTAAEGGDEVANRVVDQAATELAAHVAALATQFSTDAPVPTALGGGLLGHPTYRRAIQKALRKVAGVQIIPDPIDPVLGALEMARRLVAV